MMCVELDLEKFFARVNHDVLMAKIERHVKDKRVLRLIRRYLEAGAMADGIVSLRQEGTPQGGPLSPLLSNILLNELDRELELELERRGHRFVRYADDANIYVRSRRAGGRVLANVERFLNQCLKLTLNREKSRVARPWVCDYLGYGMSFHKQSKLKVATMSLNRLRDRLRELLRGARGHKMAKVIERITQCYVGGRATSSSARASVPLRRWMVGCAVNFVASVGVNGSSPQRGRATSYGWGLAKYALANQRSTGADHSGTRELRIRITRCGRGFGRAWDWSQYWIR